LDETRIFNYRLSSRDVKAVFDGTYQPPPNPPPEADGVLACETWYNVAPSSRLDVEPVLARTPDATNAIETSLSCPPRAGAGERLDRIQGFLFPPQAGDYTFHLQAAGQATLFLPHGGARQDTLPEIAVSQGDQAATSPPIALDAGQPRYFEVLHFYRGEAGGSLRIGWRLPGSTEPVEAIPAAHFSSYRGAASVPRTGKEAVNSAP
jgi:hypothetical protein